MSSESSPAASDRARDGGRWAGPSRRARAIAVALAVAFAALTFVVVNGVWRRAVPARPAPPTSVEVKLVPSPPAASRQR
jgi:hypothetical protein